MSLRVHLPILALMGATTLMSLNRTEQPLPTERRANPPSIIGANSRFRLMGFCALTIEERNAFITGVGISNSRFRQGRAEGNAFFYIEGLSDVQAKEGGYTIIDNVRSETDTRVIGIFTPKEGEREIIKGSFHCERG